MNGFWSTATLVALTAGLSAQPPAQTPAQPAPQAPSATFKVQVDLVTNDIIVRDEKGNFIPDLKKEEFEIYEDGVKQDISSMTVVTGGRVTNVLAPPPPPPPEGIVLPPTRPRNDVSGRIFLFFVDDLHLQFHNTGRVRDLFKRISKELVHEGDMFGIVSSGPSSIAIDMTYDKTRLDEAIKKMAGSELKPTDIINGPSGAEGPSEVRYRAHVAFSTVNDLLNNLDSVHNRRKALIYVSDGYDFNPFQDARLGLMDSNSPFAQNEFARNQNQANGDSGQTDPFAQQQKQSETFADADLARELGELTRQANRSNVTMYTIDPRGLVGMGDIDEQVDPQQWSEYVRKSQDSLRVIAEETGGIAVVNQNDFSKALKRIDAETSDYYVLGYYSKNPDATKRRRQVEVKIARKGANPWFRKEYVLKPPPKPSSSTKK
ncbi:MAG: VWFA-related Acidobacterial domain protein [Acidobacteria bacterium]|nr:VWFA-related Acidobacterial domain protein [Acidobacteriota bacterium]